MSRSWLAFSDQLKLARDAVIRAHRREREEPDGLLSDEERPAIEARSFGRTLDEIDELPTARRPGA